MAENRLDARSNIMLKIGQNLEAIKKTEFWQFKNEIFSVFKSLDEQEFEEYMHKAVYVSSKRCEVASDLIELLDLQDYSTLKMPGAYSIVIAELKQDLVKIRDELNQNDKELREMCLKVEDVMRSSEIGFQYLADKFETLASKNESIWNPILDLEETVSELDREIKRKKIKQEQRKQNITESEPNA